MPDGLTYILSEETVSSHEQTAPEPIIEVRVVRTLEDMMKVVMIRSTVYMTEQDCPFEEEFDGNDFCATHLIGFVDGEPASCIRLRFFADFAKPERMATRPQFRRSGVTKQIIATAFDHMRRKGYRKMIGHAQDRLVPYWAKLGCKVLPESRKFVFSDYSYTEIFWEFEEHNEAITIKSDPYKVIRPEGDWDRPGILEQSVERSVVQQPAIAAE